jgi:hypothetical protein
MRLPFAALLLPLLAACAAGDAEPPQAALPPPPQKIRVAKEGGDLGRIDLFHNDSRAGRMERLAHCPEGCAETEATLPFEGALLEVVATGWPFMRMSGFKDLAPCVRTDGGFMSPCRIKPSDIPAAGIVAVFYPRPDVAQPDAAAVVTR